MRVAAVSSTSPKGIRISVRGSSLATSFAEAMAVKKATGGQVAQRSEAYPGTTAPKNPSTPTGLCISARGWRNAVKPTPGQPHQKLPNPNGVASGPEKPPDISCFCDFMAKAGMRNTSRIDSGTDATPLGLGYPECGVPRVASALLRQPWAKNRIPVGDEEPSPPSSKIILPTTFSYTLAWARRSSGQAQFAYP